MMDIKQNSTGDDDTASRPKTLSKQLFSDKNNLDIKQSETVPKQVRLQFRPNCNEDHQDFWDVTWPSLVQKGWKLVRCRFSVFNVYHTTTNITSVI